LAEQPADPLLVTPALVEDLLAPLALEVAPLLDEDRGHVELVRDDAQVRAQREPDLVGRPQRVGDLAEAPVERARPRGHRLVKQVLLRLDVRVERPLLDAERLRDLADRRAVVALLREQARCLAGQLLAARAHRRRWT